MKKILFLLTLACATIGFGQSSAPFVQRNQLLTSGRVPFATTNGIVTDNANLNFTTSATPGNADRTLKIGSNVGDSQLLIVGGSTAGNTANSFNFELHDGSDVLTQAWVVDFDLGLTRWSTSYWSTLSSAYVEQSHFDPATNVTTFANGLSAPVLTSTVATGTAPFVVASTTQVANLNAATAGTATTATTATNATNVGITNDTTTNATMFPLWATANTGNLPAKVTSTKLTFNPSTGILASTGFTGTLNGNTFTAGTYTLTGTAAKTLNFTNSLTLTGTDSTTMTFPTTSATLARTDAANTFTGTQTIGALVATTVNGNTITTGSSTFTGTAAQTYTFPTTTATIARTDAAQTFTGVQTMTSPSITTSLVTASTTFALLNATATTVNAFGAATTVNTGASATQIWNFGGSTTASEFRFLEPSGSGTNYTAFKAVAQSANITYSLPATVGAAGTFLRDAAGNGVLDWAAGATISGLTTTAIVTANGTTAVQTPSATSTMDSSGNMSLAGTLTVGNAATTAGAVALTQGTTQSTGTTNITIQAPTSVTSYIRTLPGAAATGFYLGTNSAGVVTDTQVASTGSGSVVLGTSPDFTTSVTTASTSFTAWAGATTLLTFGGTGASASTFMPSTLDATSSTTGAIRTSGGISAAKALNVGTTITGGGALSIGTSNAATVGTIELGAATDTTLSRSAAGVIAVEGNIVSMVGPRLTTITSNANPTFDVRTCDIVNITAQAADITSMTTNMTITGVLDGQQLEFRILGTAARAITWGANFASGIATLPTTTTTTKTLYAYFEYDAVQAKFMLQATGSYP